MAAIYSEEDSNQSDEEARSIWTPELIKTTGFEIMYTSFTSMGLHGAVESCCLHDTLNKSNLSNMNKPSYQSNYNMFTINNPNS